MAGQLVLPLFSSGHARLAARDRVRSLSTLPRIAPSAVRVPEVSQEPLPFLFPGNVPRIFVHEGVRQSLERKLTVAADQPVLLSVTDNRHSMVRHSRRRGVLRVRVHHMFLGSPPRVQDALVRYIVGGDREASTLVGRYINTNLHRIRPCRRAPAQLVTQGRRHDLLAVFNALNEMYFDGAVDALVTWGQVRHKRSKTRKSIKLGGYNALERLVSIHPTLDAKWVPRYFLAFVVYHEMIHHMIPALRDAGRSNLHPPEFREREARFRHYERALAWEKAHLGRLLRS